MESDNGETKTSRPLKHLGFVRLAAVHALAFVSGLYDAAKHNCGPLRSAVTTVEGAVTAVVGPVYEKFRAVPEDLLVFADRKVVVVSVSVFDSCSFAGASCSKYSLLRSE